MKFFERERIHAHCAGSEWPDALGEVALGEPFVIETVRFSGVNGQIAVSGIRPGETILRGLPKHVCPHSGRASMPLSVARSRPRGVPSARAT